MTSKGTQTMTQEVITRSLKVGDKFKIPANPSQTYEVVNIKGDYLIYRNVRSQEEFQMVRGFTSKVDLIEESADYQKKRFKEPYYMYNESAKTIKEAQERKKDYLAIVKRFRSDINKHIDKVERDVDRGFAIDYSDRDEAQVLGTRFSAELLRYNLAIENKTLTEGFMVKEKSGNTYIGRFDSKDKADKAVQDLAKKYGKSAANWLVEPDDKYMAAATAKGSSSWGPIPMNTLVESFIIQDSDSNNKPVYFHYGKYTGYDWGFDKNAATKFSTKEAADRMIEKMRQEGMLINSMKVVSESLSSKTHKFKPEELKVGKRVIDKVGGHEVHGKITVNHHDLYKDNPYTQDKKGSTVVTITTDKGRSYDVDANDNGGEFILESRIAKGYENLNADERAKHLLSHPSSKYMNDLKSENITERAIRKAVKEMLGKPDKRDPQFIIDVNEEGEAPAIANTTAEVANPELPLKLKESVLPTENEAWGFFGTSLDHIDGVPQAEKFWDIASRLLAKERHWNPTKVRDWLDSKSGRHFADTVSDFGWSEGGIRSAYNKWDSMGWFDK